jgi:hypothetical protein
METKFNDFGRSGEQVFIRWCQGQGWFVIPTCMISNGGAPMAEGAFEKIVLPDLQVALRGKATWVDVKTKARATEYGKRGKVLQTGCAVRSWKHYRRIQEETGIPGALGFVQCRERLILFGYLDQIWPGSHEYSGPNAEYPTIYFDFCQFDQYVLRDQDLMLLSNSLTPPARYQPFESREHIVKQVVSQYKQGSLGFGAGERYR